MVILTDLSEVLVQGMSGVEEIIASQYGTEIARAYKIRHLETEDGFRELLRGNMTENAYWRWFLSDSKWPFDVEEIKCILSDSIREIVPDTLDVYQRIVAYPESLHRPNDIVNGTPEIYIVSDHIEERLEELHFCHPDIFRIVSKEFWSCKLGQLKMDEGFFPQLLRALNLTPGEVILVDDNVYNTTAALLTGITSVNFKNANQLESVLWEYGFLLAPPAA